MMWQASHIRMLCTGGDIENSPAHAGVEFNVAFRDLPGDATTVSTDARLYCPVCTMTSKLRTKFGFELEMLRKNMQSEINDIAKKMDDLQGMREWWMKSEAVDEALKKEAE